MCRSVLVPTYCKNILWCGLRKALIHGCSSMLGGAILLLWSLSRIIALGSPTIRPTTNYSQVLDHLDSVMYGFHPMKWPSNPTRKSLIAPITFVPHLYQYLSQAGHCCRPQVCHQAITVITFLLQERSDTFQHQEYQSVGHNFLVRNQLDLSMVSDRFLCCLHQQDRTLRCREQPSSFDNSLRCLKSSVGPLGPTV